jgi:indole-3-acetaldehyde oxidase
MADKRIDPEDGEAYTWSEMKAHYKRSYTAADIAAFWETCKKPKAKGKSTGNNNNSEGTKNSRSLLFAVDGDKQAIANPDPTLTLSDYLRGAGYTSVKLGCEEGGCGACTVTIASWKNGAAQYRSVNACLLSLCSCDGLSITTSRGLGNCKKGFHPIQERLAENNGSQCGFCSPGMVMSMFGMMSANRGEKNPDAAMMETCIDGNLCRCTGYRSILETARSFADGLKKDVAGEAFAPFPSFLKDRKSRGLRRFVGSGKEWVVPADLPQLFEVLEENLAKAKVRTEIVAGNTARGIYKDDHLINVCVDISQVAALQFCNVGASSVSFGGAVTWQRFITTMEEAVRDGGKGSSPEQLAGLKVLVEHARKVAGHSVRNLGTLGGNLAITKRRGFASDLATILLGAGASIKIAKSSGDSKTVSLDQFFSKGFRFTKDALIKSVTIPYLSPGDIFKTYRTAIRPINAHALTNAGFRVQLTDGAIQAACLAFGAFESRHGGPFRAKKTESAIKGQAVNETTLKLALEALRSEDWWPEDDFERHLSVSYLYKMFHALNGSGVDVSPPLGVSQSSERSATRGTQMVSWAAPEKAPIGAPMPKTSSKLQAAGEQTYTNDLPVPSDCLFAAYVQIPKAKSIFIDANLGQAKKMPGFFAVVTAEDIQGMNVCELTTSHKLLVPKGEAAQFAGQPCLLILADSTKHAEAAARQVRLKLGEPESAPILSVEASVEEHKKDVSKKIVTEDATVVKRGDCEKALASAPKKVTGTAFCDGQKAFYMEPATSMAIPGEDGTLVVWGCAQVPSWLHTVLNMCVAVPKNKIVVNITHIGGGFGGKLFKSMHGACVCAVAALKFQRAVKFHVNRNVDTVMCAGRLPMTGSYEVGFNDDGKLLAVKFKDLADRGLPDGCSGFSTMIAIKNLEQTYAIPNLDASVDICGTDKPGNTAIRGPGEPQSTFFMETILEHVAMELGKSSQEVREVNMFTSLGDVEKVAADPTSPAMDKYSAMLALGKKDSADRELFGFPGVGIWAALKKKTEFQKKDKAVNEFNATHRWRKRGVAMTPVKYTVEPRAQNVLVCLYPDGTCLITCDGTEVGQGLHTKVCQFAAHHLSQIVPGDEIPVSSIRCGPNGTDKIAVGSITGGSTTSEGVCEAVRVAVERLMENMRPTKEKMEAEAKKPDGAKVTFKGLVGKCGDAAVELQASANNPLTGHYQIYGAALSEVEVDVLTGETVILHTSMIYDCGKSLNPTIDLGQCEGAFIMGVGFFLRERLLMNSSTGELATDGTWEYKIPCFQDVPLEFDVEFFKRPHTEGVNVMSSKASGEPPLVLATSVFCAVRHAIAEGRKEFGHGTGFFRLDAPATPRDIALLIGATSKDCDALAKF